MKKYKNSLKIPWTSKRSSESKKDSTTALTLEVWKSQNLLNKNKNRTERKLKSVPLLILLPHWSSKVAMISTGSVSDLKEFQENQVHIKKAEQTSVLITFLTVFLRKILTTWITEDPTFLTYNFDMIRFCMFFSIQTTKFWSF